MDPEANINEGVQRVGSLENTQIDDEHDGSEGGSNELMTVGSSTAVSIADENIADEDTPPTIIEKLEYVFYSGLGSYDLFCFF